jgi:methionyl aminopeptidase
MTEVFNKDKYLKAGKAVAEAKKLARKIIEPGIPFLEVADKIEDEIYKNDCELAFPVNMSLDQIAAHYSPIIDDTLIIPEKGLLKIDCGAHYDGFVADSAITINLDEDPQLQNFIEAAKEALEAAISIFHPGVRLYELGEQIEKKVNKYGLNPIKNLGGHELKQFNLHAGPFIPNYKEKAHNLKLTTGVAFACEPFTTSGVGLVKNGKQSYIYRFIKKAKKNIPYEELAYMNKIETSTKRLPFSPRLLDKKELIPKNKIQRTIDYFLRKKVLDHYPILIEQSGAPVAQEEHTIILDLEGNTIVTTRE